MAGKRTFHVTKERLDEMYQLMTLEQIAKTLGVGQTVVHKRIHEFGIKLRGYEEAPRTRPKKFTPEHLEALRKLGLSRRGTASAGDKNNNWRGGLVEVNLAARRTGAYVEWKRKSLELAGNKCQSCGVVKGSVCDHCGQRVVLHVHHIKSFAKHIDLRFDPTNSEVLCVTCHHSRHFGKSRELLEHPTD